MPKVSSQNSNMLIKFVKNNRNKKIIINLLSDILNLNINDFYGTTIEKFEDISEYKFSLIKLHVILSNKDNLDIHLRIIDREKIKENIFCYWSLVYEKELEKKPKIKKKMPLVNKVTISDIGKERYKSSVLLEIPDNPYHILEYGVEVHFVDIIEYISRTQEKYNRFNEIEQFMDDKNENLLLVGLKLNKTIGRSNIELV